MRGMMNYQRLQIKTGAFKILSAVVLWLLITPCAARADIAFSESSQFQANLRQTSSRSLSYRDSADFSIEAFVIARTYADANSFSFDWLANSQPMAGPTIPPLPYDCEDLLVQYNSSTNQWGTPSLSCPSPGQPVIVLNHGWNSSTDTLLDLAEEISNRIPGIYIYSWHWGEGEHKVSPANPNGKSTLVDFAEFLDCFNPFGGVKKCLAGDNSLENELIESMTNAAKQGICLGESLLAHGIRPDLHKIHLIGHSYGGVVCAKAAETLWSRTGSRVKQITTLDTPALYFPYAIDYVKPESAERVEVFYYNWNGIAWIDDTTPTVGLAMGALGGPLNSSASNILNFELNPWYYRSITDFPLHFRAGDWYKESIGLSALNCEDEPYGFGWSVSLNTTSWQWNDWPLGNENETMGGKGCPTPLAELIAEDVMKAADKVKDTFDSAKTWVGNKANLVIDGVRNSAVQLFLPGSGQQSQDGKFAVAKMDLLSDTNDAYIYKEVNIPPGTDEIALDVRFSAVGEGDKLTLSVGDEILIVIDPCAAGVSDAYQTYYASVSDYAGQTAIVQIALRPSGTGQSVALVDNLRFTTLTLVEDITGDKAVDYADLSVLAQNWLVVGCNFRNNCDGADIDRDNKVDFVDFARLASYWLESF
jgi:pimeloyl-ACP methyl ester carboxylesterase